MIVGFGRLQVFIHLQKNMMEGDGEAVMLKDAKSSSVDLMLLYLGEDCVPATGVQLRVSPVLTGQLPVDEQLWQHARWPAL